MGLEEESKDSKETICKINDEKTTDTGTRAGIGD